MRIPNSTVQSPSKSSRSTVRPFNVNDVGRIKAVPASSSTVVLGCSSNNSTTTTTIKENPERTNETNRSILYSKNSVSKNVYNNTNDTAGGKYRRRIPPLWGGGRGTAGVPPKPPPHPSSKSSSTINQHQGGWEIPSQSDRAGIIPRHSTRTAPTTAETTSASASVSSFAREDLQSCNANVSVSVASFASFAREEDSTALEAPSHLLSSTKTNTNSSCDDDNGDDNDSILLLEQQPKNCPSATKQVGQEGNETKVNQRSNKRLLEQKLLHQINSRKVQEMARAETEGEASKVDGGMETFQQPLHRIQPLKLLLPSELHEQAYANNGTMTATPASSLGIRTDMNKIDIASNDDGPSVSTPPQSTRQKQQQEKDKFFAPPVVSISFDVDYCQPSPISSPYFSPIASMKRYREAELRANLHSISAPPIAISDDKDEDDANDKTKHRTSQQNQERLGTIGGVYGYKTNPTNQQFSKNEDCGLGDTGHDTIRWGNGRGINNNDINHRKGSKKEVDSTMRSKNSSNPMNPAQVRLVQDKEDEIKRIEKRLAELKLIREIRELEEQLKQAGVLPTTTATTTTTTTTTNSPESPAIPMTATPADDIVSGASATLVVNKQRSISAHASLQRSVALQIESTQISLPPSSPSQILQQQKQLPQQPQQQPNRQHHSSLHRRVQVPAVSSQSPALFKSLPSNYSTAKKPEVKNQPTLAGPKLSSPPPGMPGIQVRSPSRSTRKHPKALLFEQQQNQQQKQQQSLHTPVLHQNGSKSEPTKQSHLGKPLHRSASTTTTTTPNTYAKRNVPQIHHNHVNNKVQTIDPRSYPTTIATSATTTTTTAKSPPQKKISSSSPRNPAINSIVAKTSSSSIHRRVPPTVQPTKKSNAAKAMKQPSIATSGVKVDRAEI